MSEILQLIMYNYVYISLHASTIIHVIKLAEPTNQLYVYKYEKGSIYMERFVVFKKSLKKDLHADSAARDELTDKITIS